MNKLMLGTLLLALGSPTIARAQRAPASSGDDRAAIVWTGMQQPVPEPAEGISGREIPPAQQGVGQSTERPERREQPNAQQPGQDEQTHPAASSASPTVRTLTGTIVKENNGYFLHRDDNSEYQLDDPAKVRGFENRSVRITGTVDSSTRSIHVQTVQPPNR